MIEPVRDRRREEHHDQQRPARQDEDTPKGCVEIGVG